MRTLVAAAVACLLTAGLSHAGDARASIKRPISIPAQGLGSALQTLSKEGDIHLIFISEDVKSRRTQGVTGDLTVEEALQRLLSGTGLTYQYIDEETVSILPLATAPRRVGPAGRTSFVRIARNGGQNATEASTSWRQKIRLAQAEQDRSEDRSSSSSGKGESVRLEEIVVTAQRREERLEDVPISISVLTGEQLDSSTLTSLKDTLSRVPGIATLQPSIGNPVIVLRGVSPSGAGGIIGYYVDSVPFGFARLGNYPDMNLYDFDRIEVLRGPQGTLYGANSVAGVVRLLTKSPDLNRFEAKTRASVATITDGGENYRVDAAVNIPIIEDRLAMRLVGGYEELGGWIDKPFKEDANDKETRTLRAKLRAQPTDALTLDATAWFSRRSLGAQDIGRQDRATVAPVDEPVDSDFDTYSLTAGYDFGGVSLTSATSYIDFFISSPVSLDFLTPGSFVMNGFFAEVFSEELTLQSTREGPWRWTIGAMYRDAKDRWRNEFRNGPVNFDYNDRSKSSAIFGEATRELLNGKVEATIGLRYFRDEFSTAQNVNPTGGPLIGADDTSDAVTPRAVLAWHPTDTSTVYASYAQGFRSGTPQTPATLSSPLFAGSGLGSVKPDKLSNYEIGAKGTLFDGRLSLDTSLYYMEWEDIKVTLSVPLSNQPGFFFSALVNGPGASGVGVDTAISIRPTNGLEIGGNVSWNDLTSDEDVLTGGLLLLPRGDRLTNSPETTANGFVEVSFPLGSLTGRLYGSVNYVSSLDGRSASPAGPVVRSSDSLTTTSARFTIESGNGWVASLFGDNLGDENGITSKNQFDVWDARNPPRTIGVQVEYHWN